VQISSNLARQGPVNIVPPEEVNISGKEIMKGVMQVSVFGKF